MRSYTTPFIEQMAYEKGDTSINPHQPTFFGTPTYAFDSTTWTSRPNSNTSKTLGSTTSLVYSDGSSSQYKISRFALAPGHYYINSGESFSAFGSRKVVIGSTPNSGATYQIPICYMDVVGVTSGASGHTQADEFYLRICSSDSDAGITPGSYLRLERSYLPFIDSLGLGWTAGASGVSGYSGCYGCSGCSGSCYGGPIGGDTGPYGRERLSFLSSLVGTWEIVSKGWTGGTGVTDCNCFTVRVPNTFPKGYTSAGGTGYGLTGSIPNPGIPYGMVLGSACCLFTEGTVYNTVVHVMNNDGFLLADAGTNVYLGTDGLDPFVIVNDATGSTLANYPTDQFFSNSAGVHTLGNLTLGSGMAINDFPVGVLAQGASKVVIDGADLQGNYISLNVKESAVATVENSNINRNVFGVIAQDGGHVNFIASRAGEDTATLLANNSASAIAVIDGASARIANTVVRKSPSLVAFDANQVQIDALVGDEPTLWLDSKGTTGNTGYSISTGVGVSGTNYTVFVSNSKVSIREPSPASTIQYGYGPSEIPVLRILDADVRVMTAVSANFGASGEAILEKFTNTQASPNTKVVKSISQIKLGGGASLAAPPSET